MRKLILIFCGVFCCLTALHAKDPALYLYQVDALDKVFKDRRYFVDEIDTLAVARGEYATLQVPPQKPLSFIPLSYKANCTAPMPARQRCAN